MLLRGALGRGRFAAGLGLEPSSSSGWRRLPFCTVWAMAYARWPRLDRVCWYALLGRIKGNSERKTEQRGVK